MSKTNEANKVIPGEAEQDNRTLVPTAEDFQRLWAVNPVAKAQLETIVWERKYRELVDSTKSEE
jgi:hypothetical protein